MFSFSADVRTSGHRRNTEFETLETAHATIHGGQFQGNMSATIRIPLANGKEQLIVLKDNLLEQLFNALPAEMKERAIVRHSVNQSSSHRFAEWCQNNPVDQKESV